MRCVFILMCVFTCVCSNCDKNVGPPGQSECVHIKQYNDYQWATCLSDEYIKIESNGRHYCLDGNKYCYYQCMIEFNYLNEGDVFQNCSCKGENAVPINGRSASLPAWCYTSTGSECNWYTDCFKKVYDCSGENDDVAIVFPKSVCELNEEHGHTFTVQAHQWLNSTRRCLQIGKVPLIRPWVKHTCSDVRGLLIESNEKCFSDQTESICNVGGYDFFRLFVTSNEIVKSLSVDSLNSVNNLFQIRLTCERSDSLSRLYDITVVRIKMESKKNIRHTVYNNFSLRSNMAAADTIAKSLSAKLEWEENGISWYAWTNLKSEYAFVNHNASLFILLSSKVRYDFKYQYTDSISNVDSTVRILVQSIESGGLFLSVGNLGVNITSLEACDDLKCQHVYLDTDRTDNNDGYCPAELYEDINWWKTKYGERDIQPCPSGSTGNSSRICSLNGKWENPVYINCVGQTLIESSTKLQNLENIVDPVQVSNTISEVLDSVGNSTDTGDHDKEPIKSGDLEKTTDILSHIIRIGNSKNATVNSEKVVNVINAMLNSGNNESWTEVNKQGQSEGGSANILKIVEDLGSLIKKGLSQNESKIIKRANLEIEISEMKPELTFPPNSKSLMLDDQPVISGKFYTAALYKTMSSILPTAANSSIGSDVISLSFDHTINHLEKNITITFNRNKQVDFQNPEVSCGYWNFTNKSWSYSGCYLKQDNAQFSTCTCNHLTNFAILMSPSDVELSDVHQKALEVITFVGCGLSLLGCFLTLVIYFIMWRYVRNEWAVILVNICVILIIGYSVFIGAVDQTENDIACNIITAILHYSFLVVFFLMLAEGISVATSVTVVFKKKSKLPIYLTLAWVIPILIVGITMGATRLKGYHSDKYCWLPTDNFVFMAFVGPALVIIVLNIGTLCLVLRALYSSVAMANERIKKKARAGVKCMVTLLPVLGLSWLFGVLAFNEETIVFQYLFGITTSCQGLCIFIFHTVLNKKVHEGFRKILYKRRLKAMSHVSTKPRSSASNEKIDSRVNSTDTTNLRDLKNDSAPKAKEVSSEYPRLREMKSYLKINRSGLYHLTKS